MTAEDTPAIDTRSTLVAHNVTAEEIERMPKGRSFQSLALTAPSVNEGQIEGGIQVNGASGAENSYTVDGVVTNSLINGQSRQNTVFEYLQEVQVKTTGIGAEYGGALGGVISAVTKSGGNQVRGEAHYFYEGSALAAAPVKRLVLDPSDDVTVSYVQDDRATRPPQRDRRFDRRADHPRPPVLLRLVLSPHRPRDERLPVQQRRRARADRHGQTADAGLRQGDLQRDAVHGVRVGAVHAHDVDGHAAGVQRRGAQRARQLVRRATGSTSTAASRQTQTNATGNVDVTLGNSSFVSVRGGYFYDNYKDTNIPDVTNYIYQTSSVGHGRRARERPGADQHPEHAARAHRRQGRDQARLRQRRLQPQLRASAGNHSLKGGVGYQRTVNDADQAYPGGYVNIYWDRASSFGRAEPAAAGPTATTR